MTQSINHEAITFVLCAAGRGERFVQKGLLTPKPLLKLKNKSMLERSIESLELEVNDQLIIISQRDHNLKEQFQGSVKADWLEINGQTGGQLETFMRAKDLIKNEKIVIYNCDTFFRSTKLREIIHSDLYEGIIPCSQEPGEAWSFCKVDDDYNVIKVAEKERISEWASVGYYYFKGKDYLFYKATKEIQKIKDKENYVAPLYEEYLEDKKKIKMVPVEVFLPFGTIEQVRDYWGVSIDELIAENQ